MKIQLDLQKKENGVTTEGMLTLKVAPNEDYIEININCEKWYVKLADLRSAVLALK